MAVRKIFKESVSEGATTTLKASFLDEVTGEELLPTDIQTLTLTLYDEASGGIIADTQDVDVHGSNGGTFNGSDFTMRFSPAQNVLLDTTVQSEVHVALFEWTYYGGRVGRQEVAFTVDRIDNA